MKNLKRVFSALLAMIFVLSAMPAVMAEGEETGSEGSAVIEPEIMFYRDFEDYTGGNITNISADGKPYGTFGFVFDTTWGWSTTIAAEGVTGKGFVPNRTSFSSGSLCNKNFPEPVKSATDGKIYITFTSEDIPDVANNGNTAVAGTDGYRYFGFDHGNAYSLSQYGSSGISTAIPETSLKNYKIDVIFDLTQNTQATYINNVLISNKAWNSNISNPASSYINFWFENGVIIDNLAMLYYPENIINQNFSLTSAKVNDNGTISVFLKSDAVDSDGKGSTTKSKISAPYGIALPSVGATGEAYALAADTFSVEDLHVTSVTRGTAPGEYVIAVEEEIADNTVYTVSAKAGLTDILGATINSSANSIDVCDYTEPEILFYRDYEDYTGGNPIGNTNNAYGTFPINGDGSWTASTKADSADGTGFYVNSSNRNDRHESFPDKTDGTLYVAFDEIPGTTQGTTSVYFDVSGANYPFAWKAGKKWSNANRIYSSDFSQTKHVLGAGKNHKIELVIDVATGTADRYINGNYIGNLNFGKAGALDQMLLKFSATSTIDNLAIVYYPENIIQQTFSLESAEVNTDNNTISVFLKSDAIDSDGKGKDTKSAISAPYGITLPSTDTTNTSYTLSNDTFAVDGLTVTGVTRGTKTGEYVIAVEEEIEDDTVYTVTANAGLKDILGAVINGEAASVSTTAAPEEEPKFEISSFVRDGATATVTYTNTTDEPESFVIIIASYLGDRLSEVVAKNITAVKDDVDKTETVTLANGVDGKTVKAFIWESITTVKPLMPLVY